MAKLQQKLFQQKLFSSLGQKKTKAISKQIGLKQIRTKVTQKIVARNKNGMVRQKKERKFRNELKNLVKVEQVTCPICFQVIACPVMTECGHIFCLNCIENTFFLNQQCAICRRALSDQSFQQSKQISILINEYIIQNYSEEEKKEYKQKVETVQELQRKRMLPDSLKVGDLVDFNYKQKWIEGRVLELYNTYLILATQKGSQKIKVLLRQRRLAKHRTFTKKPPLKKMSSVQRNTNSQPNLMFITEPNIPEEILHSTNAPILNTRGEEYIPLRWDEFQMEEVLDNWINLDIDANLQGNVNLWDPNIEENEFSLFL